MKTFVVVVLMTACTAVAQGAQPESLNPKRVSATEILREGGATHFRGNVTLSLDSLTVYCQELEYLAGQSSLTTSGDARLALQEGATDFTHVDVADPSRFHADEIRQDGDVMTLHGNVVIMMPGWKVLTEDAVFNKATATITVRGKTSLYRRKGGVVGVPNTLGPVFLREGQPGTGTTAAAVGEGR